MLKPLLIITMSLAFMGCATNSKDSSASSEKEKVASTDEKNEKVICKRQARVGSHFKTTQCWTAEEYARKQKEDQERIRSIQNSSAGAKGPEGR